ncbi:MAG TPA: alpha/beta fold hydrolase [Trebonia sp.]|nr:alpha/beta fold hydrolase [Trebonia sp.]
MSTPTTLELPEGVRRTTAGSARGTFAVLEALPVSGLPELGTALLVPGYTGSKEDFITILGELAAGGRRVLAVDMRGQYQTPGPDDPDAYRLENLGQDIAALAAATETRHLVGHSYGGLVSREAILSRAAFTPASFTLLSSGPAAVPGERAKALRYFLDVAGDTPPGEELRARVTELWQTRMRPRAEAAGVPADIVGFLTERMLASNPAGLVTMAADLLDAEDRTAELATRKIPTFILYGEDDDAWPAEVQEEMAAALRAARSCIPGAAHSPAVEAPATTAAALTDFWDAAEGAGHPAATTVRSV